MLSVVFVHEFNTSIINYQGEGDWAPHVLPQAWRKLAWMVTCIGNSFREEVVGYFAGNWNPIHMDNVLVHPSICCNFIEIVMVDYILRDDLERHPHVFGCSI